MNANLREFNVTHPLQPGWYARGMHCLPEEIVADITERYSSTKVNPSQVIEVLCDITRGSTAVRHTEEFANLDQLI